MNTPISGDARDAIGPSRPTLRACRILAASLAIFAVFPIMIGNPGWTLPVAILSGTLLFSLAILAGHRDRPDSIGALVPIGFVALTAVVIVFAETLSVLVSHFSNSFALTLAWALPVLSATTFVMWRPPVIRFADLRDPSLVIVTAGVGIWILAFFLLPKEILVRQTNGGTDFLRHVVMVGRVADQGSLVMGLPTDPRWYDAYPKGIHAVLAAAWSAASDSSFQSLWIGVQGVLWMILVFIASGVASCATWISQRLDVAAWLARIVMPVAIGVGVLLSMWHLAIFRLGFVTTMVAGLCLIALILGATLSGWPESLISLITPVSASIVVLHSWPLLAPVPVLALAAMCLMFLRSRRWSGHAFLLAVTSLGCVLVFGSLPILNLLPGRNNSEGFTESVSLKGSAGLMPPDIWWGLVLGIALVVCIALWRRYERRFVLFWVSAVSALLVVYGIVFVVSKSSWIDPGYYPLKVMWTGSVLVLPLAFAGATWMISSSLRFISNETSGVRKIAVTGILAVVLTLLFAVILGRSTAQLPRVVAGITSGALSVALQIPVVTALEQMGRVEEGVPIIVWGVSPYAQTPADIYPSSSHDVFASESSEWMGFAGLNWQNQGHFGNGERSTKQACRFLEENPTALRVTGPNRSAGPDWLVDSGCPVEVVKPEAWVSIPIDNTWFVGTRWEGTSPQYPTYAEFQQFVEEAQRAQSGRVTGQ